MELWNSVLELMDEYYAEYKYEYKDEDKPPEYPFKKQLGLQNITR